MATIEQLLGASAKDIDAMDEKTLEEYLKDITSLEPLKINLQLVGLEEEKDSEDDLLEADNPIKKKPRKKKKSIEEMDAELKALEKELGF